MSKYKLIEWAATDNRITIGKYYDLNCKEGTFLDDDGYTRKLDNGRWLHDDHVADLNNVVNHPSHYQFYPELEAIEIIKKSLTAEEFRGYCIGNSLKYRLRAGGKGDTLEDIAKADKYKEFYEHR